MRRRREPVREDFLEGELRLALRSGGCAVCVIAGETERAVVAWLATTKIREERTIEKLVDARGLCAHHWAGVLERRNGDLGVSGARVLARIAEAVAAEGPDVQPEPAEPCPVCASVSRRERLTVRMLFALLADPVTSDAATWSPICRPHLRLAFELDGGQDGVRSLAAVQHRSLRTLAERAREPDQDVTSRVDLIRRIIEILAGSELTT